MKIILYIATSEDGFIADAQGNVDWLPQDSEAHKTTDEFGYEKLLQDISIILMGRTSYEQILSFGPWAWPTKHTYVFSPTPTPPDIQNSITFVQGDVTTLIRTLDAALPTTTTAWLLGGANLAHQFLEASLVTEIIITIAPIILGSGIALTIPYGNYTLISTKSCTGGLIQKTYLLKEASKLRP